MRPRLFASATLATLACVSAGLAAAGCAAQRPADAPSGETRTTSVVVQDPSYGNSDIEGWTDPAASGNATHGTATMGATTPLPRPAAPSQLPPVIVVVSPDGGT
jgi:hypothetical protein